MLYNDSLNCFTDSRDIFEWADKNNHINFVCEEQIYYENLYELKILMLKESVCAWSIIWKYCDFILVMLSNLLV